eukprot:550028-Pyramimonas_sp.AAC.1
MYLYLGERNPRLWGIAEVRDFMRLTASDLNWGELLKLNELHTKHMELSPKLIPLEATTDVHVGGGAALQDWMGTKKGQKSATSTAPPMKGVSVPVKYAYSGYWSKVVTRFGFMKHWPIDR